MMDLDLNLTNDTSLCHPDGQLIEPIELIPHNHTIYNGSEVSSSTNEDLIPNATFRPS